MILKRQKLSKICFTQKKKLIKFKALSWQAVGLFIFAQSNHKLFSPINLSYLGLIHMRHFYTQYCDKKILRYFRHRFQCPTKVSYNINTTYLVLCFVKTLPWLFNRNLLTEIKISFYRNIAILNCVQKCLV